MLRIILLAVGFIFLFGLSRYLRQLSPADRKAFYRKLIIFGLVGGVFYLALTGRLHFIAAIVAGILPFIKKMWPLIRYVPVLKNLYQQAQAAKKPASGSSSHVTTSLLEMALDHDSGDLDGEVLDGPYQGKMLSELSLKELLHIHRVAQTDYSDSVAVLEAYLDRMKGDEWRNQAQFEKDNSSAAGSGEFGLSEAYAILGLEEGASKDDVVQAHRKLMQKLHPDRGGSDFLAAQVNRAKDMILEALEK